MADSGQLASSETHITEGATSPDLQVASAESREHSGDNDNRDIEDSIVRKSNRATSLSLVAKESKITELSFAIVQNVNREMKSLEVFFDEVPGNISIESLKKQLVDWNEAANSIKRDFAKLCELTENKVETPINSMFEQYLAEVELSQTTINKKMDAAQAMDKEEEELREMEATLLEKKRQLEEELKVFNQRISTRRSKSLSQQTQVMSVQEPRDNNSSSDVEVISAPIARESSPDRDVYASSTYSDQNGSSIKHLAECLANSIKHTKRTVLEPEPFKGNPLEFADWETDFDSFLESQGIQGPEKMRYLKNYVLGDAKDCISGQLMIKTEHAYKDARQRLRDRFGKKFSVSRALRQKLDSWPKIQLGDSKGFQKYADYLNHCQSGMESIPELYILNDSQENEKMASKLPDWAKRKWAYQVLSKKRAKFRYPSFAEFASFIADEAELLAEPILQKCGQTLPRTQPTVKSQVRTLHTSRNEPERSCLCCNGATSHFTTDCYKLAEKPYDEKITFVQQHRLCYSCLEKGHSSKACNQRATCKKCKKSHPTCLHKSAEEWKDRPKQGAMKYDTTYKAPTKTTVNPPTETSKENDEKEVKKVYTKATKNNGEQLISMVVPVYISTRMKPQEEVLVYALLDTQSDCSYITKTIADTLEPASSKERVIISTMNGESTLDINKYENLRIRGYTESAATIIKAYEWRRIPCSSNHIPNSVNIARYPHLRDVARMLPPSMNLQVGLLIGANCPEAFAPLETVLGNIGQPFAQRTMLGWTVFGATDIGNSSHVKNKITNVRVNATSMTSNEIDEQTLISQDDMKFLEIMEQGIQTTPEGSYQMPLPFKTRPWMPKNRIQAEKRLTGLKKKFESDINFKNKYETFMEELFANGHAEEVNGADATTGESWYIPHFGVKHPKKDKLRVVFDCSAVYADTSLNQHLLQGPDLLNSLLGILCRFRKDHVAIACDIEKMYYNFFVDEKDRDYLRFLWPGENGEIKEYRMTVHLFGATSSPAVATYGLRRLADKYKELYPAASAFIQKDFYVDDGITSVETHEQAKELVSDARELCSKGNLRLHKFVSNDPTVLAELPATEITMDVNLFHENLPSQRTLGLEWNLSSDYLWFSGDLQDKPCTRRGILSVVSQLFDPLGLLAPYTLIGKNILQKINQSRVDWDEPVKPEMIEPWNEWFAQLTNLSDLHIPRCVKPSNFGQVVRTEFHHFSDASCKGIGACSYIRFVNEKGDAHSSLMLGKSKVVPSKGVVTIPRLELQGAVLATQLSTTLRREMNMKIDAEYYWTDSTIVLGYLSNESKRFHIYVSNRVRAIREHTDIGQWRHVPGEHNPADGASRGMSCTKLESSNWFRGPSFLSNQGELDMMLQKDDEAVRSIREDDPEVKKVKETKATSLQQNSIYDKFKKFGTFKKLTASIAQLQKMAKMHSWKVPEITTQELADAAKFIVLTTQSAHYRAEIEELRTKKRTTSTSLKKLFPFLDDEGLMRVGGRSKQSLVLSYNEKHPVILPRLSHISRLLTLHYHAKTYHQGQTMTLGALRGSGYWVVGAGKLVKEAIHRCVPCQKLRGKPSEQLMGDLPKERVQPSPPFTHIGIDCFGPYVVKERRTEMKRWGLILTCMYSRAVHVELLEAMTTDALLNALRCFVCIRGPVATIRCDQGTNFVGASNELAREFEGMNAQVKNFMKERMIEFRFNPPHASHAGGVWERQIRTVKSVLNGMATKYNGRMDTAGLRAAFYEAMATINSRPLSINNLNNPTETVITPNHILTMKPHQVTALPGDFNDQEIYGRKMWKKVQQFAEEFWVEWKNGYLDNITKRQKWEHERRSLTEGDMVLIMDDNLHRNQWTTAIVEHAVESSDGCTRKVRVRLANPHLDKNGKEMQTSTILERPIQKLVLLLPSQNN